MPKTLSSGERQMVLKVKYFCELEKRNEAPLIPLRCVQARVAAITGISEKTVSKITKEAKVAASTSTKPSGPHKSGTRCKINELTDLERYALWQKMYEWYSMKKELPTPTKLLLEMRNEIDFKGRLRTLSRIVKDMSQELRHMVYTTNEAISSITPKEWKKHVKNIEQRLKNNNGPSEVGHKSDAYDMEVEDTDDTIISGEDPSYDTIISGEDPPDDTIISGEDPSDDTIISGEDPSDDTIISGEDPPDDTTISGEDPSDDTIISGEDPSDDTIISGEDPSDDTIISGEDPPDDTIISGEDPSDEHSYSKIISGVCPLADHHYT